MKIYFGSLSEIKINTLEEYLKTEPEVFSVLAKNIDSGVSSQPMSENITIKGALNRAKGVRVNHLDGLSLGVEVGLVEIDSAFFFFAVSALIDLEGVEYLGISRKIPLPKSFYKKIKNGEEFAVISRDYLSDTRDKDLGFDYKNELVTRKKVLIESMESVFWLYKNRDFL